MGARSRAETAHIVTPGGGAHESLAGMLQRDPEALTLIEAAIDTLHKCSGCDFAFFWLADGDDLGFSVVRGRLPPRVAGDPFWLQDRMRQFRQLFDSQIGWGAAPLAVAHDGLQASVVPLLHRGVIHGAIGSVLIPEKTFRAGHNELLGLVSRQTGLILDRLDGDQERSRREQDLGVLSLISHELNTPLNAVVGFMGMMPCQTCSRRGVANDFDPLKSGVVRLHNSVRRIEHSLRLITGLSAPVIERMDVAKTLLHAIDAGTNHTETGPVATRIIVKSTGRLVAADRSALDVLLNEVIANAVKHRRPGSRINFMLKQRDRSVVITVKNKFDPFELMALSKLKGIFKVSRSLHSGSAQGLGIGLLMMAQLSAASGLRAAINVKGKVWIVRIEIPSHDPIAI